MWDLAADPEWNCTEKTEQDPAQGGSKTSFLKIEGGAFRLVQCHQNTDEHADTGNYKKVTSLLFMINEGRNTWKQHKCRFDL